MSGLPSSIVNRLRSSFGEYPELGSSLGGADEFEICRLAERMGVNFSPAYSSFLRLFGAGIVGSLAIYGTSPIRFYAAEGTVEDVTSRFRNDGWPVAKLGPVLSTDQAGNPIVETADGLIIVSDHDFGGKHALAPTFVGFLSSLMDR